MQLDIVPWLWNTDRLMFKGILHSFVRASYLHFFTFPPKRHIFISLPSHQSVISSFLDRPTKASYLHFFTFPPNRNIFISSLSHQSVLSSFLHCTTKASYLHFFTFPPKRHIFISSLSHQSVALKFYTISFISSPNVGPVFVYRDIPTSLGVVVVRVNRSQDISIRRLI
jgi:hypothetical protein